MVFVSSGNSVNLTMPTGESWGTNITQQRALQINFLLSKFNPFSHGVFFVSRLTAVGHMRHPFQSRPRWKMKTIMVSVCASIRPNTPREIIQNRAARWIFTFFAITSPVGHRFEFYKDWLNPQSMLIPNLFHLFWMFASKGFKSS